MKIVAGTSVASGPYFRLSCPVKRNDMVPMTIVSGKYARPTCNAS